MINLIYFYVQGFNNIMMDQLKVIMADPMFNISLPTSEEIVDNNYLVRLYIVY